MILFSVNQSSLDETVSHAQRMQERILEGIRLGMRDGVKGLAEAEVEAASSHHKSGLLEKILGRAGRVVETDSEIKAVYNPRNQGKQPHYWLEDGVNIPAVDGKLMAMDIQGETIFRYAHKAFTERAQPFFFSTAEGYQGQFFERLQARIQEATNA